MGLMRKLGALFQLGVQVSNQGRIRPSQPWASEQSV